MRAGATCEGPKACRLSPGRVGIPPAMNATSDDVGLGQRRRRAHGRPCCGEAGWYGDCRPRHVRSAFGRDRQYNGRRAENEDRHQTTEVADSWPVSGLRRLLLIGTRGRIGPPASANARRVQPQSIDLQAPRERTTCRGSRHGAPGGSVTHTWKRQISAGPVDRLGVARRPYPGRDQVWQR